MTNGFITTSCQKLIEIASTIVNILYINLIGTLLLLIINIRWFFNGSIGTIRS